MKVSVIIPAHNTAGTIAETLASLRAQTFQNWEAIVVDDGSSDQTAAIASRVAERDDRIRIMSQSHEGVSAARNKGMGLAHFDWVLFLDADDWLLSLPLERMTRALTADAARDAVQCGWTRVAPDGTRVGEKYGPQLGDLFPAFTGYGPFAMYACLVRRSLVEAVGGFDSSLRTCEDWDLWQRIARAGARFGAIREILALYRMRPGSASSDGARFLADDLRVIAQGHSPDSRVRHPLPTYAEGLPAAQIPSVRLHFASWPGGLVLGRGEIARPLLNLLADDHDSGLDPAWVAACIFESALPPTCSAPEAWLELWPCLQPRVDDFLLALEAQAMAPRLAQRTHASFERMILAHAPTTLPLSLGDAHGVRVEITKPLADILPPTPVERLQSIIELEGTSIGTLELPVCDGRVRSYVLADAIAAEFAWPILGRFFECTVYRELSIEREPTGLSLRRGPVVSLTTAPSTSEPMLDRYESAMVARPPFSWLQTRAGSRISGVGCTARRYRCLGAKILLGSTVRGSSLAPIQPVTGLSRRFRLRTWCTRARLSGRFSNVSGGDRSTPSPTPTGRETRSSGTASGGAVTSSGCLAGPV